MGRRRGQLREVVVDGVGGVFAIHGGGTELVQIVDTGDLHVTHVAEEIALVANEILAARQVQHQLFMVQVHQVFQSVAGAPLGLHAVEALTENAAPDVPVVGLHAPGLRRQFGGEEERQVGLQIVALLLTEGIEQFGRPGNEAGVVWFVAEEAEHGFAELLAKELLADLVGGLQISARGVGVQVVDKRVQAVLRVSAIGSVDIARGRTAEHVADQQHFRPALRRSRPFELAVADGQQVHCPFLGRGASGSPGLREGERAEGIRRRGQGNGLSRRHGDAHVRDDSLHGELRILLADLASGEATGVAALVGQPHLHAALAGLFDGELSKCEMFRR